MAFEFVTALLISKEETKERKFQIVLEKYALLY